MMRGLAYKVYRETRALTCIIAVAIMAGTALLTLAIPQIQDNIVQLIEQLPFLRPLLSALFGIDVETEMTRQIFQGALWVQPLVLSLTWIHAIALCSRFPVTELERGTLDVLLSLPVSRRAVYGAETIVWILSGLVVFAAAGLGSLLVGITLPEDSRLAATSTLRILINFFALYLAIGGMTCLVSSMSDFRGRAIGVVLAIVLASFLLNFLAEIWTPAQRIAFLSVLRYYQPAAIISQGAIPVTNMIVLLTIFVGSWTMGGEILARRSLCTV